MNEEQEVLQLAMQTMMTQREAQAFLWLVADWQRNHPVSEAAMAEIKQTAIESGARARHARHPLRGRNRDA